MLKFPAALRSRNALVTVLGVVLIAGTTTVVAQTAPMEPIQWDKRRLEQLDRNVRRLERAVTQRNAAGQRKGQRIEQSKANQDADAQPFLDFLKSDEGAAIFARWGWRTGQP